jgi:hypothetical protein
LFGFLRVLCGKRSQGGLDPERLEALEHLCSDRTVNSHAPERNAAVPRHGREGSATDIALRRATRAAIGDRKLLATSPTAEKTGEQRFATSDRATSHVTLPVCVIRNQTLIPFELSP